MFQTVSDHSDKPTYSECCQSLRAKGYVNEEIWALMNWCAVRMIFWLNGLELASLHLAFTVLEGFVCSSSIGNSRWWVSQSFWKCVCSSKPSHVVKQLTTREWCWWLIQWKLSEGPTFMDLQSVSWHGFSVSHTQCSWYLVRSFQWRHEQGRETHWVRSVGLCSLYRISLEVSSVYMHHASTAN